MLDMLPPPSVVGSSSSRSAPADRELALRLAEVGFSDPRKSRACQHPVKTQFSEFPSRCGKCDSCREYKRWISDVRVQLEIQAADHVYWGRVSYKRDPDALVKGDQTFRDVERELYSARVAASLDRLKKVVIRKVPGVRLAYVAQAERGSVGNRLHHHVLLCVSSDPDGKVSQNDVKQAFSGSRKSSRRIRDSRLSAKALALRVARDKARAYLSSAHQLRRARVSGQQMWQTVKKRGVVSPARGSVVQLSRYLSKYLSKSMDLPTRRSAGFGSYQVAKSLPPEVMGACVADMKLEQARWFEHRVGEVRVPWALVKPLVKRFERGRLREVFVASLPYGVDVYRKALAVCRIRFGDDLIGCWPCDRAAALAIVREYRNEKVGRVVPVCSASQIRFDFG